MKERKGMDGDGRKKGILLAFIVVTIIHLFVPLSLAGVSSWDVDSSWRFFSGTASNSGPITFSSSFTTTQIQITGGLVMFTNFDMGTTWNSLGFHTPQGATMQVQSVTSNTIACNVNPGTGLKTWKIYVGSKELPVSVTGADYWDYWDPTKTVSISSDNTASVTISWTSTVTAPASTAIDVMDQFLQAGNLLGGFNAVAVGQLGLIWYVLLLIAPTVVVYQRFGAAGALFIWVLFWGTFQAVMPSEGISWATVLMVVALGGLIAVLYFGRRSPIA